jgi:6-phosphogluconolactonase
MTSVAATFVYVGSAESQDVTVLALAPDGDLTLVATQPVPGPAKPGSTTPMAVSPDKKLLYVGLRNEPYSAASFTIAHKTGTLSYIGSGPLVDAMAYIATDRTGRFLLSASYGGGKIAVSPIGGNGVVAPAQQVIAVRPNAHCIMTDPSNRYVLYSSLGSDAVFQQRFDAATGRLTPNNPSAVAVKAKAGPRHFVFSRIGRSSICSTSSTRRLTCSRGTQTPARCKRKSRSPARCRRASPASPGRPTSMSPRTANSATPPSAPLARSRPFASIR